MKTLGAALLLALLCCACQSAYYGAMEKLGYHKREILVDRVEDGREAQQDAKKEFQSALKAFQAATGFHGGDLEALYDKLSAHYEACADKVETVDKRIESIEDVSERLFDEWKSENGQMQSLELRSQSEQQLADTRARCAALIGAMKKAAAAMPPVLTAFKDRVLYLKHNLNALAIASLSKDLGGVESDVHALVAEMERSIAEADAFIAQMGAKG